MPDLVSDLIDEVGRIERENEAAYLELGRIFPRLLEEMEHSAEKGERSFSALAAIGLARSGESSERGQSYSLEGAKRFFLAVREQDSSFLAKINEGISRLDELEGVGAAVDLGAHREVLVEDARAHRSAEEQLVAHRVACEGAVVGVDYEAERRGVDEPADLAGDERGRREAGPTVPRVLRG